IISSFPLPSSGNFDVIGFSHSDYLDVGDYLLCVGTFFSDDDRFSQLATAQIDVSSKEKISEAVKIKKKWVPVLCADYNSKLATTL
uniref:Uncharacterized protein n=1 Tax=Romanomermis culicivorax TaxID=13658 RepID=A0A915K1V6_ROMCU